jgi:signal peptidase I
MPESLIDTLPAPAESSSPPGDKPPAAAAAANSGGGVKETIESILVAFILAFVFRAFVVEAFVIPTGSMATTLLGAHTRFHCPDCGYDFDLNYSSPGGGGDDDDVNVPSTAGKISAHIYCPNCGFQIPGDQTDNPAIAYGDRILVLKYLYQVSHPHRWDVVVFKAPEKPNQNYIKRLTGLPGEAIMVLDGDIYVRAPGDPDPKHFVVQPKTPAAQSAMWRLVYDNDFHPEARQDRGGYPWQQPWKVDYGAAHCQQDDPATHGRVFTFDDTKGAVKLTYDPLANPSAQGLSDYLVANQNTHRPGELIKRQAVPGGPLIDQLVEGSLVIPERDPRSAWTGTGDIPVSDLDLRLTYQRTAGNGPLQVAMTKRGHTFTAELTPTTVTLYHDVDGHRSTVGNPLQLPAGDRPVRVELSNADYHAVLQINGSVVAETTPNNYAPDLPALLREYQDETQPPMPTVAIVANAQQGSVSHLSLWRDVYYYDRSPFASSPVSWATPRDFPNGAQQLGPDEYFTMGDNSQLSWDARCWTQPVHLPGERLEVEPGKVPGRFLLGRAFYVYWPAGYKATDWLPSFVPNFAGMRLIR